MIYFLGKNEPVTGKRVLFDTRVTRLYPRPPSWSTRSRDRDCARIQGSSTGAVTPATFMNYQPARRLICIVMFRGPRALDTRYGTWPRGRTAVTPHQWSFDVCHMTLAMRLPISFSDRHRERFHFNRETNCCEFPTIVSRSVHAAGAGL